MTRNTFWVASLVIALLLGLGGASVNSPIGNILTIVSFVYTFFFGLAFVVPATGSNHQHFFQDKILSLGIIIVLWLPRLFF